jgi:hypothetical protein
MRKLMAALAVGMAAVSPKELAAAEAYAMAIYRAAGIDMVWTETPWAPGGIRSPHLRVATLGDLGYNCAHPGAKWKSRIMTDAGGETWRRLPGT